MVACCVLLVAMPDAAVACRSVGDNAHIDINPLALKRLEAIGMDRDAVLAALAETSQPETSGCWSGATGNFDNQRVSVGIAQWNFGQDSLQPLLKRFRQKYPAAEFDAVLGQLMPAFGARVFSNDCLHVPINKDCDDFLLAHQTKAGVLEPAFKAELDALFESDPMTQIQADVFVGLVESVSSKLDELFPGDAKTPLRVKWALDMRVQQGSFPALANVERVRGKWLAATPDQRSQALASVFRWYDALCGSLDQQGVRWDCDYNNTGWCLMFKGGLITDEAADLLLITHLRSRVAAGDGGLYQALAFQRRAKIILGVGSVAGRTDHERRPGAAGPAIKCRIDGGG